MTRKHVEPGDFDLVVRRSRTGLGLFANQPIAKGACVIEYTGRPISEKEQTTSRSRYLFEITDEKWIDGAPRSNRARYINHSCKPNCEIDIRRGRIFVHARRNIRAGEELGYDYGKEYVDAFIAGKCLCPACAPDAGPKRANGHSLNGHSLNGHEVKTKPAKAKAPKAKSPRAKTGAKAAGSAKKRASSSKRAAG